MQKGPVLKYLWIGGILRCKKVSTGKGRVHYEKIKYRSDESSSFHTELR